MEAIIYLVVKCTATGYLLYRIWLIVIRHRLFGLWDNIPVRRPSEKKKQAKEKRQRPEVSKVIGKILPGYIANPVVETIPLIAAEPEANDEQEEFEVGPDMERPSAEELYGADNVLPQVTDNSTGLTYEQLSEALEYVAAPVDDDDKKMRTAETLSLLRNSDIFEFIEREVSSTEAIGHLLAECLDGNGFPLKKRKPVAEFDMGKYV